jgi:hypothetical protein
LKCLAALFDSIDFWCDDKLDNAEQNEESIDFFLKIPSRESRLNRGDHRDRLNFNKEHKSRPKRKKGIIQGILTQTPIRIDLPTNNGNVP